MIELPTLAQVRDLAAVEQRRWSEIEAELRRDGLPLGMDDQANFAYSLVATAPSPASSGTSLVVTAGQGARFPAVPFNAVIWAANANPLSTNAEIVRVTARSTDTLTITRAQESTSARTVVVGDQIAAALTRKTVLTDLSMIGAPFSNVISPAQITADTNDYNPTGLATASVLRISSNSSARLLTGISASGAGATDGRVLVLMNVGTTNSINLVYDATSTAANRFLWGGGSASGAIALYAGQSVLLIYDGTSSRWRVVSAWGADYTSLPLIAGTASAGSSPFLSARDHVHPSEGVAASTYTPTLTQSVTVAKTVTLARYIQVGKLVFVWLKLTLSGAGTANNPILVGLPATAVSLHAAPIGSGDVNDASASLDIPFLAYLNSTSAFQMFRSDADGADYIGKDPNFAVASGDTIDAHLMYEAA